MRTVCTLLATAILLVGCSGESGSNAARPAGSGAESGGGGAARVSSTASGAAGTQPSRADLDKLGRAFGGGESGASGLPPGHPPVDGSAAPRAAAPPRQPPQAERPLRFDAPEGWQAQTVTSAMRKAQFVLPRSGEAGDDGEMVLFYFGAGQGGSVQDNLDRWRGMFKTSDGQPVPSQAASTETFESNGLKVTTLDVSGQYAPAAMPGMPQPAGPRNDYRMLAAVVETPDGPWFFRGVGPNATMAAHRDRFLKMLRSVRVGE